MDVRNPRLAGLEGQISGGPNIRNLPTNLETIHCN